MKKEWNSIANNLQNGNQEALVLLYESMGRHVFLFAYSILKNKSASEDAVQNTFIKVKNNIHQFKKGTNFSAWVFTIAKNFALTELKKSTRNISLDEYQYADTKTDIETMFANQTIVKTALQTLSSLERQIVILSAVEGYKMREIATILEIPLGTALWRYNKSIKKMREALQKEES